MHYYFTSKAFLTVLYAGSFQFAIFSTWLTNPGMFSSCWGRGASAPWCGSSGGTSAAPGGAWGPGGGCTRRGGGSCTLGNSGRLAWSLSRWAATVLQSLSSPRHVVHGHDSRIPFFVMAKVAVEFCTHSWICIHCTNMVGWYLQRYNACTPQF